MSVKLLKRNSETKGMGSVSSHLISAAARMEPVSCRSGVGSDDVTEETVSLVDVGWSSDEDEVKSMLKIKLLLLTFCIFTCHMEDVAFTLFTLINPFRI